MEKKEMTFVDKLIAGIAILLFVGMTAWMLYSPAPRGRVVNCALAEFHPDFTPKDREMCRLIRSGKWL
jgi:hypothetical protein